MQRHWATQGGAGQITHRTDPATSAACFAPILQRNAAILAANPSARGFILQRLLKMVPKSSDRARGRAIIAAEPDPTRHLPLSAYFTANLWLYRRQTRFQLLFGLNIPRVRGAQPRRSRHIHRQPSSHCRDRA